MGTKENLLNPEMYLKAIEGSDSGLWVCDMKAGMCFLSNRYYTMLGYVPGEFEGTLQNLFALLHPDDQSSTQQIFDEYFRGLTDRYRNEVRLKNKSGGYTHILTQGTGERNAAGELTKFIGWNIDITPLKEAQKKLDEERTKSAGQSRLAQLGILAGGLTHEVNNPLTVIQVRTQMMERSIKNGETLNSEKVLVNIEAIQEAAKKIELIIDGLRTIAYGGSDENKKIFSINKVLDEVIKSCRGEILNRSISLHQNIFEKEFLVLGNITLIGQVFLNLIYNAMDAVENSPQKAIWVDLTSGGHEVFISIMDNGPGVLEENQEKIFLPFFTTKEPGKGTGLGLSISSSILKTHHGSIEYRRFQERSQFVVKLPLNPQE